MTGRFLRGLTRVFARLCGRGDTDAGRALAEDVADLFRERQAARGFMYATARAALDVASLMARPRPRRTVNAGERTMRLPVWQDLQHARRNLIRRPLASAAAFAAMTLGLALAALTCAVVRGVLWEPLPFPDGSRLVSIYTEFRPDSGYDIARSALSWPEFLDYQAESRTMDVVAYLPVGVALARSGGEPERVSAARMTSGAFALLGVAPAIGQTLTATHDEPGGPCGAVLSDGLWRDRFAASPSAVGEAIRIDGAPCIVLGVMPSHVAYPGERTRLWIPFPIDRNPDERGSHGVLAVGRLRRGATLAAADEERAVLMASWTSRHRHHVGHGLVFRPLLADLVGEVRLPLLVLAASVALVLLVMAASVSGLFLAQGEARRRELAVREALGAGRGRLVRQLTCEALLITGAGGLAGTLLAALSMSTLLAAYPGTLPRAASIEFGGSVAGAMTALSLAIGLLVAVAPAVRLTRGALPAALRAGDRGASQSRRPQNVLVGVELALAVSVTIAAMLLIETFARLQAVPLGFDPEPVAAATVSLPIQSADAETEATTFFNDLIDRLRRHPAVAAAGAMSAVPLVNRPPPDDFSIEGRPAAQPGEPGFNAHYVMATPGALEAIGATLVRGRLIESSDRDAHAPIAVVNERLGQLYWPDADPVGRRIRYPTGLENGRWTSWTPWITIVGVVRDVRSIAPSQPAQPAIYVSYAQRPRAAYSGATMGVVVRAAGERAAAQAAIREAARGVDARSVAAPARPLDALVGAALARPQFMGGLMSSFAIVTVVIALIGMYGLVASGVEQRTREIGVRIALGATHRRIVSLVARRVLTTLGTGVPAGLLGAWLLARWMSALLYEVRPWEPQIYALVAVGLAAVVCVAVAVPVRRALAVDPLTALRAE